MEKTFLTCGIIVTALTAFAFSQHKQSAFKNISITQPPKTAIVAVKDTVPVTVDDSESKYSMSTTMDGKQYRMVEVNGKVTELYVDNVKVPDDKIPDYSNVIDKLHEKLKADKEAQKEAMKAQKEALKAQAEVMTENQLAMNDKLTKLNEDMANQKDIIFKEQAEKFAEIAKQKNLMLKDETEKQMKDYKEQAEKFAEIAKQKNIMLKDETEKQMQGYKVQAEKLAEMAKQNSDVIKVQVEQQTKMIKDKTDKLINEELKKQIEELKEQNEKLQIQLNLKMDSIHQSPPEIPQGA